ncbi:unnamed protein product [Auanema sp. JU1783]|nr:unnamed protein product [Auanema sp. JU1783]
MYIKLHSIAITFSLLIRTLLSQSVILRDGIIGTTTQELSSLLTEPRSPKPHSRLPSLGGCRWFGLAPLCIDSCPAGFDFIRSHTGRCENGTACVPDPSFGEPCLNFFGTKLSKKYCCRSDPIDCSWSGRWTGSHDAFNFYCRYEANIGKCGRLDCSVNSAVFQSHNSSLITGENCDELEMWNLRGKASCSYIAWFDAPGELRNSIEATNMDSNLTQVAEVLQSTVSTDVNVRRSAEAKINEFEKESQFGLILIRLVSDPSIPAIVSTAASITLKNFIKKNWSPTPEIDIPSSEEEVIRSAILSTLFDNNNLSSTLQNQLSHALHLIAQRDFPARWPDLVPTLASLLGSDNPEKLITVLSSLDQLFKKFRYEQKSVELWTELKNCLLTCQEPLTNLFKKTSDALSDPSALPVETLAKILDMLHYICRVFHSLSFQDIPEYFEDHLKEWVDRFLFLMPLNFPAITSAAGDPTSLDKMKAEICEIFTLYAQRYEEEINPFMPSIIQSVWQLVVQTGPEVRYDGMICSCLSFLSIICQKQYYEQFFTGEGVLQTIAQDVCIKNLVLRPEDLELFEDEPVDFMKRDLEGTDVGTRRRGSIDLVRALCRRFETALIPILGQIIPSLCADGTWMKMDIVYCLVTAMASKTETAKAGATSTSELVNVLDYYSNQVRTHLAGDVNETPILRMDAVKFVVTFRNQLPLEVLVEVIQAADRLLQSTIPMLHKYAAYAIEKVTLVKNPQTNAPYITGKEIPVESLLSNLVGAFDKDPKSQNSPYLIRAVLRVVALLDDNSSRHAGAIATQLANLVDATIKNPADPVHTHFLFETMCVLIRKTANLPGLSLDEQLMPLIETIMTKDIADLIPYALQITGVLLTAAVSNGSSSDKYIAFLTFLLDQQLWARSANVPAALSVVEVYLKHAPEKVLSEHSVKILGHFARLMGSKSLDNYGFQLANALLPSLEMIQGVDSPIKLILNNMFQRIQNNKTPKFLKMFIVFLARFIIVRGADDLAKSMNSIQPNMLHMVIQKVVIAELPSMQNMTTQTDKRLIAIGFARLLGEQTNIISDLFGELSMGVTKLIEASSVSERGVLSPEEEQAAMYNAEGEFTNPYCRLSYAAKAEPVAPQIANYKAFLAEAILQRGPANNSTVMSCISEELRQHLTSYVTSAN